MSWVKLDDRFFDNPKIAALSDGAQLAYLKATTYCARELTDGFVATRKAREYASPRAIKELTPGLWEPCAGGYQVHDYLKYNPTRAQVLAEREAAKRRMSGLRSGGSSDDVQANIGRSSGEVHPSPVDPVDPVSPLPVNPIPPAPTPAQVLEQRPNIFKLYEQLFGKGVSPLIAERLKEYETTHSQDCITHCFQEAAESNARNVKLVYTILDRHKTEGCYGNGGRKGRGKSATAANPNGVAAGVPGMDRRSAAIADRRRRGVPGTG